jgi:suppressor for copper-sensitivity B
MGKTTISGQWARLLFGVTATVYIAVLGAVGAADAASGASDWARTRMADIRLVSAASGTGDAATVPLGLQFKLAEGWKIYWRTPGDAGFPPNLEIKNAENLRDLEWKWPVPHRFSLFDQESHGYKDEVVFPIAARIAEPGKPLQIDATVHALACSDICVPLDAALTFTLPAGPAGPTAFTQLISRYRSLVPSPLAGAGLSVTAVEPVGEPKPHSIKVSISSDSPLATPDIFVETEDRYRFGKPVVELTADARGAVLTIPASLPKNGSLSALPVTLTIVDGDRFIESKHRVGDRPDTRATGNPALTKVSLATWLTMLGLGLLGGFILNFMPCVLPVLSLKLLGVLRHGGGELTHIRRGFIASALGIVTCFMILAVGAIAMKQAGLAIGWGIQFQQPLFLAFMIVLLAGFAANLFGWLEIPLPGVLARLGTVGPTSTGLKQDVGGGRDLFGHFLTGGFAALLATPCSAPFLGTALGFALARGPLEIVSIFLALGTGLALPYLLVAARPSMVRRLPRPGAWMDKLRVILGLALVVTAIWLFTVVLTQIGIEAVAAMAGLLVAAAGLLAATRAKRSRPALAVAGILSAIALFVGGGGIGPVANNHGDGGIVQASHSEGDVRWIAFDAADLTRLVSAGEVVFVDVTADWCLTCKVNKSLVLDKGAVAARLAGGEIVAMRADWTKPNARIAAYLASFQRYGIPFNAVYGPGLPDGLALPELLTKEAVLAALDKARGGATKTKRTASVIPDTNASQ